MLTQDPPGLAIPDGSPTHERPPEETVPERLREIDVLNPTDTRTEAEIDASLKAEEAKSRAVVLEIIGDIPDADVKPPDQVLFICKLNPVTRDSDLELIFSRFGEIKRCASARARSLWACQRAGRRVPRRCSCEVIRDYKTAESLCYAFIEYENQKDAEEAYFKMNNVLIDDRRIKAR